MYFIYTVVIIMCYIAAFYFLQLNLGIIRRVSLSDDHPNSYHNDIVIRWLSRIEGVELDIQENILQNIKKVDIDHWSTADIQCYNGILILYGKSLTQFFKRREKIVKNIFYRNKVRKILKKNGENATSLRVFAEEIIILQSTRKFLEKIKDIKENPNVLQVWNDIQQKEALKLVDILKESL